MALDIMTDVSPLVFELYFTTPRRPPQYLVFFSEQGLPIQLLCAYNRIGQSGFGLRI